MKIRKSGVVGIESWAKFPWLKAGFSTRQGGKSQAYGEGEQKLGWTNSDPVEIVRANRKSFMGAVAGKAPMELVTISQFHSAMVRQIVSGHGPLTTPEGKAILRGDALITDVPGLLLGVQTADCVPVLVADKRRRVVAAFHAGWRGTLARIVERGIGDFQLLYGSAPKDIVAAIGPCIAACCFAVGEEVRSEFEGQFAYSWKLFSEAHSSTRAADHLDVGPQIHLDLVEANRRQLLAAGLKKKNVTIIGECTACTRLRNGRRKYFSHRAEHGFTGRMMSVIGVTES
jgi:YfiH family protein